MNYRDPSSSDSEEDNFEDVQSSFNESLNQTPARPATTPRNPLQGSPPTDEPIHILAGAAERLTNHIIVDEVADQLQETCHLNNSPQGEVGQEESLEVTVTGSGFIGVCQENTVQGQEAVQENRQNIVMANYDILGALLPINLFKYIIFTLKCCGIRHLCVR